MEKGDRAESKNQWAGPGPEIELLDGLKSEWNE